MSTICYIEDDFVTSDMRTVQLSRVPILGEQIVIHNRWYNVIKVVHFSGVVDAFIRVNQLTKPPAWIKKEWWWR